MGWEERRGHLYYYRSLREGKRVRKEYAGGGGLGRLAAQIDELERQQREGETTYWREKRKRFEQSAAFVGELEEAAQILSQAHLIAAGFRKRRGEWRRIRERS
jgi:hypothetical protein